jgi:NAD(P)-dependent dehydrogenase (short-subunit alcohol dehydrogenase family)
MLSAPARPIYDRMGLTGADLDAAKEGIRAPIPLGRYGTPGEVASAIVHLASPHRGGGLGGGGNV